MQQPGGLAGAAGGRRMYVAQLAKAGLSQGLAGLFLEAHPNPSEALCDGPSALKIDRLRPFLEQMKELDYLIKSQLPIDTA